MKKLLFALALALFAVHSNAQAPQDVLRQPASAGYQYNAQLLNGAGGHFTLASFDTSGQSHRYLFKDAAGKELGIAYKTWYFGKNADLGDAGTPGIGEIVVQGQYTALFPLYKTYVDRNADMEKVSEHGSMPVNFFQDKNWRAQFYKADDKGNWFLKFSAKKS
jgi:hypothetical protein